MPELSPELETYLLKWHATSTGEKAAQGNTIDLPFEAFLALFAKRQLITLQKAIDGKYLQSMQARDEPYSLVLTWRSYAACSSGIFNADTACVCARFLSKAQNMPKAGDKLRPGHVANIAASLTGVEKTPEHCQAISDGKKGVKIAGWSDERKLARSQQIAAKKAANAAQSEGENQ
jgi:hypothetical protein